MADVPTYSVVIPVFHSREIVADTVAELAAALPAMGRVSFRQLTEGVTVRLEVIVRFLAVLELYKQGRIEVAGPSRIVSAIPRWFAWSPWTDVTRERARRAASG